MPFVVDTSFLVDLARRDKRASQWLLRLEEHETLLIPTVVVAEYLAGSSHPEEDLERLDQAAEILAFTREDALAASVIARETLADGVFPGWTDCLIGGVAKSRGDLAIVTANPRHFPRNRAVSFR